MWQMIGAGISALAGLFGDDDEKEVRQEVDYEAMARNAERAGFNPLTALRNGGAAGFTNTYHPALSMEDRLGSVFSTLGNAIMSFDARADERAAMEDRLMRAQLQSLNLTNEAAVRSFIFDVPSAAGSTVVDASGRPPGGMAPGERTNTNPYPQGSGIETNPAFPDAEMAEARYGDIVQEIFGIGTLGADVYHNLPAAPAGSLATVDDYKRTIERWLTPTPNPKPQGNPAKRPKWPYTPTPGYNPFSLSY